MKCNPTNSFLLQKSILSMCHYKSSHLLNTWMHKQIVAKQQDISPAANLLYDFIHLMMSNSQVVFPFQSIGGFCYCHF